MSYVHELARRYNEALYQANPRRAEEIEWFVDAMGNLRLRDIPELTARRTAQAERRREADRKRWVEEHHTEHRPFAPPEAGLFADERERA